MFLKLIYRYFLQRRIKKQTKFFKRFLEGNYETLENHTKQDLIESFQKWLNRWHEICNQSTSEQKQALSQKRSNSDWYSFTADFGEEIPSHDWVLVESAVFTGFFPSLNEMDTWALCTRITDLVILLGLHDQENEFYVHMREHLVNHQMVTGVILFDLYIKK